MKLKNILKAFFVHKEESVSLDLSAAEIRDGKAFLHPKDEAGVTYLVRSDNIEISLSKGFSLTSKDVIRIGSKQKSKPPANPGIKVQNPPIPPTTQPTTNKNIMPTQAAEDPFGKYKKKQFSISLYQDEYDTLIAIMKEYGYSRADFVLACASTATRGTMERAHKKIVSSHKALKKEQKDLRAQQRNNNPANL